MPHFWLDALTSVLAVTPGLDALLRRPDAGLMSFSVLLIVYSRLEGVALFFRAQHPAISRWGCILRLGVLSGSLLSVSSVGQYHHRLGAAARGVLMGILLISEGAALAYLAWQVRAATAGPPA